MDIDPKTYPSRIFARFTAYNQLKADATGQPITASVQRLGGKTYVQEAIPGGEAPSISADPSGCAGGFKLELSTNLSNSTPTTSSSSHASQDLGNLEGSQASDIDEALFEEIVKTTLNPGRFPDLYQSCGTQTAAMEVEAMVAAEIVNAYRSIKQKQNCPIVQSLNNLL